MWKLKYSPYSTVFTFRLLPIDLLLLGNWSFHNSQYCDNVKHKLKRDENVSWCLITLVIIWMSSFNEGLFVTVKERDIFWHLMWELIAIFTHSDSVKMFIFIVALSCIFCIFIYCIFYVIKITKPTLIVLLKCVLLG